MMSIRRWIAWRLVQLAARIHDTEVREYVLLCDDDGAVVASVGVVGDGYGCGIVYGPKHLPSPVTSVRFTFDDTATP